MKKIWFAFLVLSCVALLRCGSSDSDCPFPAESCPAACFNVEGTELDRARRCRNPVFLGCSGGGVRETSTVCHAHEAEGRIVQTAGSALASKPGWRPCTSAELDEIFGAARCEDLDGGPATD
jgi:hypothetical protein